MESENFPPKPKLFFNHFFRWGKYDEGILWVCYCRELRKENKFSIHAQFLNARAESEKLPEWFLNTQKHVQNKREKHIKLFSQRD